MSGNRNIDYSMVAAFERLKEPARGRTSNRLFTVLLMAVFFIVLMIGLAAGVHMYQQVSRAQAETNDLHLQSGLLANTVHVNDTGGGVSTGEGPEGPALVLTEQLASGTYETRIYLYEGHVVQEYAIAGRDYNPASASKLAQASRFEFSYDDNGLITLTTDSGSYNVTLRSAQGEASAGATISAGGSAATGQNAEGGAR